ncbi:leucine-rich repeat domain-containing protein [Roseibacillus ishigakijimensis]|uniref:leucine-rich repeat domain-containing protein n=1 Tax=Roseibacillus ishigakijimensis TaxID=454146 RepID=UPI00363D4E38
MRMCSWKKEGTRGAVWALGLLAMVSCRDADDSTGEGSRPPEVQKEQLQKDEVATSEEFAYEDGTHPWDDNLTRAIQVEVGKRATEFTGEDIQALTSLDCSDWNIASLDGIEKLRNLEELTASSNAISDLSPLAHLKYLRVLRLDENRILDVSEVDPENRARG